MNMAIPTAGRAGLPDSPSNHRLQFERDVLAGLAAPQKTLPCKYFYDEIGSKLFESICELEDYYLTRVEADIFSCALDEMTMVLGQGVALVEPGAGNCEKAEPLLVAMNDPVAYYPLDISPEILLAAQQRIQRRLPTLDVVPVIGDFTSTTVWQQLPKSHQRKVLFFPGSTIGNFTPEQARELLQRFAEQLRPGEGILLGADLVKDSVVLERAYHDSAHVTEAFNKNLLTRINNELNGNFNIDDFAHRAFYHRVRQRVEMHLVSLTDQKVEVSGQQFEFAEGETIHTENSHKYTLSGLRTLLHETGFTTQKFWTDNKQHYAIYYAEVR
ncbi:L-histidine N(alpha)-methyltransferase [Microbulbifer bruguierae]|uniref:L-histidine N(Alpha)-methyltransferase n=1 Tax=Microbulbifer bruguierae TaxID=3029061 RepID=A0ABY8NDT8_9GAMM|nr:L-histidine N(alpha)-methyltransferase [Microbulbifer bruguierae]WGL17085.1 L-histidine N(alpha)-methyltransferase [Microbulbifer bruguierae]